MTTVAPSMSDMLVVWTTPREQLKGLSAIQHLWNRLQGMYPGQWSRLFPDAVSITNWEEAWAAAFAKEGLTPRDITTGIDNSMGMYTWPPSLPEFLKACRPNLIPEVAFLEAARGMLDRSRGEPGVWTHPAIFWAAVRVGQHDVMNLGYAVIKTRWENALRDVLLARHWDDIPPVAVALPAPGNTQADRDEAARRMREMSAAGVLTQSGRDPRQWVQKVLDRPRCSITVRQMAERAAKAAHA